MAGLLAPIKREKAMGKLEVRETFTIPKMGTIAGCIVTEGKITRKAHLRLIRDSVVIYNGKVGSLRRFKDDVVRGRAGLRVRSVDRGLQRPQGRRHHRSVRDRDHRGDAGRPRRREQHQQAVTVAIARVTLFLGEAHSLKDKRMVLRKIKDLVRNKFNVSVSEVSEHDRWQRAVLGLALVGSDRKFAESAMDEVLRFIRGHVQVSNEEKELQSFGDELAGPDFKHWEE